MALVSDRVSPQISRALGELHVLLKVKRVDVAVAKDIARGPASGSAPRTARQHELTGGAAFDYTTVALRGQ